MTISYFSVVKDSESSVLWKAHFINIITVKGTHKKYHISFVYGEVRVGCPKLGHTTLANNYGGPYLDVAVPDPEGVELDPLPLQPLRRRPNQHNII